LVIESEKGLADIDDKRRLVDTPEQGPIEFKWDHEPHGSFIRGESTEVSLSFDSTERLWRLRICKKRTSLGEPVAYEVVFKERYCPTADQAIALANTILNVELRD
jgi:hypothetical protein